jgi:hypothetical protein
MLGWSTSSISEQKAELEEVFSTQMNKINEDLIFENVWFPTTPTRHVNVTLTNVGTLGLNVTQINFVNSTDTTSFSFTDAGIVSLGSYSTNATYVWSDDEVINLIVFTDRGNQFTTQVIAP